MSKSRPHFPRFAMKDMIETQTGSYVVGSLIDPKTYRAAYRNLKKYPDEAGDTVRKKGVISAEPPVGPKLDVGLELSLALRSAEIACSYARIAMSRSNEAVAHINRAIAELEKTKSKSKKGSRKK